jgi:predicted  nucleic acid-binding Zn-ribbon protein
MPHQCLKCGLVFEEGSAQLLKGCPDCGGNRFFFTKEPLDEKARDKITEKVGKDINTAILELMGEQGKDMIDPSGNWVKIKPKDIRKAVEQHRPEKKIAPEKKEDIEIITDESYRKSAIEQVESEVQKTETPETIDIEKPGKYKIDLKGLLEEEPIIIQKDGSYTIHLPSIFKMIDKDKKD